MPADPTCDAGMYRQVVQPLTNQGVGQDASGKPADDWQPLLVDGQPVNIWCRITPSDSLLASNKQLVGAQVTAQATHLIESRYTPLWDSTERIQYMTNSLPGGAGQQITRVFEVDSVTDIDERHVKQIIACRELKQT